MRRVNQLVGQPMTKVTTTLCCGYIHDNIDKATVRGALCNQKAILECAPD